MQILTLQLVEAVGVSPEIEVEIPSTHRDRSEVLVVPPGITK